MSKVVKQMVMDEVRGRLDGARDLLVVDVSKMDAVSAGRMRMDLRKQDIHILGVKNTLARHTLGESGTVLESALQGPSWLVWGSADVVALSREIQRWADKIEHFNIKGGVVEGTPLDTAAVKQLSKSPSREELISQIAGMILSPGANLAAALLGPGSTLASQLKTIHEKEGEGGDGEPSAEGA